MSNQPIPPWPSEGHRERFLSNTMPPTELQAILSPEGQHAVQTGNWDLFWENYQQQNPDLFADPAGNGEDVPGFPQGDSGPQGPVNGGHPAASPFQGFHPQQGAQQGSQQAQGGFRSPQTQPQAPRAGAIPRPPVREAVTPVPDPPQEPSIEEAIQLMGIASLVVCDWIREHTWEGCTLQLTLGHEGLQVMTVDIPPEEGAPEVITGIEGAIERGREGEALYRVLVTTKQHVNAEIQRLQAERDAQQRQSQQRQPQTMGRRPQGGPAGPRGPLHRLG